MTGVEILNSYQSVTDYAFNWNAFWLAACIIMGIILVIGVIAAICEDDWSILLKAAFIGLIGSSLIGGLIGAFNSEPIDYETYYEVTVSDEVTLNEFYDKYEIVRQAGKIYTVKEK